MQDLLQNLGNLARNTLDKLVFLAKWILLGLYITMQFGVNCTARNRAATRDITSVMKSLPWAKQYGLPMDREHFRYCMSVKALVNATMIAGGRKESTTNDLKVQQADFG